MAEQQVDWVANGSSSDTSIQSALVSALTRQVGRFEDCLRCHAPAKEEFEPQLGKLATFEMWYRPRILEVEARLELIEKLQRALDERASQVDYRIQHLEELERAYRRGLSQMERRLSQLHDLNDRYRARFEEVEAFGQRIADIEALLTNIGRPLRPLVNPESTGTPLVSVVIPTYDRPASLVESVQSVADQTLHSWELVVVADGPQKQARKAIEPFLDDARIRYVEIEKSGVCRARNRGIAETSARFIAYLDDDNLWYRDFLAQAAAHLLEHPDVDLVYGALVRNHDGPRSSVVWRPFNRQRLERKNYIDTNVLMHRRTLVKLYGGWDENEIAVRLFDWDLALRYTKDKAAVRIPVLSTLYRDVDGRRLSQLDETGSQSYFRLKLELP